MATDPTIDPASTWNGLSVREPRPLEADGIARDEAPYCAQCYRDLDACPGHDGDPEALEVMAALVHALRELPGLHPVPVSIVREINRCEDYLRKHNPEYLNERP